MPIRSFRQKWLESVFAEGSHPKAPGDHLRKIRRLLDYLETAQTLSDLAKITGYHELKGNRKGTYAWTITANYRLTFTFSNGDAESVDYEDYH